MIESSSPGGLRPAPACGDRCSGQVSRLRESLSALGGEGSFATVKQELYWPKRGALLWRN